MSPMCQCGFASCCMFDVVCVMVTVFVCHWGVIGVTLGVDLRRSGGILCVCGYVCVCVCCSGRVCNSISGQSCVCVWLRRFIRPRPEAEGLNLCVSEIACVSL